MFNKFLLSSLTSVAILAAVPMAMAADYDAGSAPAAYDAGGAVGYGSTTGWGGFYAGVIGGFDWAEYKSTTTKFRTDGFSGGVFGGFNIEEGGLLYGVDARLNFSNKKETVGVQTAAIPIDGDVRARVGVVYGETLVYAAGGLAMAKMDVTNATGTDSKGHLGWTIGVGGEQNLGGSMFARAEYSYSDYFDASYDTGAGAFDAKPTAHSQLKIGLGLRF